jgi:branched-subunit amino acid aminotransferase/4-amino-4-deoxychorismate lyase
LKIEDGVLVEFDRHRARMNRDAARSQMLFDWNRDDLQRGLPRVVDADREPYATLRVCILRNRGSMLASPGPEKEWVQVAMTADRTNWGASNLLARRQIAFSACSSS